MFIKTINIKNFKSFIDEKIEFKIPNGGLGTGLNVFVGENNSGKSTVFEAINFLRDEKPSGKGISELKNKNANEEDEMFVEIMLEGEIEEIIDAFGQENKKEVLKKMVFDENGKKNIKLLRRSSEEKKLFIWNSENNTFENPSGIEAPIKKLFEIDFIWADTNPEDIAKFGATTICGKLLGEIVKSFENTDEYKDFSKAHQKAFNDPASGLKKDLLNTEKRTKEIFCDQFGNAEITFHFEQVEINSFFKNTKIKINDGIETYLEEKGSGMQRSVALALLQVYAEVLTQHPENPTSQKPFYLFIDEPEICLHPQAQKKLLKALKSLTQIKQIFITSHSPYFIDSDLIGNVYRFENKTKDGSKQFSCSDKKTTFALKEKENRIFFFHHRDLFFSQKVFFFEGVSDYERFSVFCETNDFEHIVQDFYFLTGKDDWKHFKKLCDDLHIQSRFIFDLDVISKNSNTFLDQDLKIKIQNLGKDLKQYEETYIDENGEKKIKTRLVKDKKQRCEPLFDENLTEDEKKQKYEIIEELKQQNLFVLTYGMLENYFDKNGEILKDGKELEKEKELKIFFDFT